MEGPRWLRSKKDKLIKPRCSQKETGMWRNKYGSAFNAATSGVVYPLQTPVSVSEQRSIGTPIELHYYPHGKSSIQNANFEGTTQKLGFSPTRAPKFSILSQHCFGFCSGVVICVFFAFYSVTADEPFKNQIVVFTKLKQLTTPYFRQLQQFSSHWPEICGCCFKFLHEITYKLRYESPICALVCFNNC